MTTNREKQGHDHASRPIRDFQPERDRSSGRRGVLHAALFAIALLPLGCEPGQSGVPEGQVAAPEKVGDRIYNYDVLASANEFHSLMVWMRQIFSNNRILYDQTWDEGGARADRNQVAVVGLTRGLNQGQAPMVSLLFRIRDGYLLGYGHDATFHYFSDIDQNVGDLQLPPALAHWPTARVPMNQGGGYYALEHPTTNFAGRTREQVTLGRVDLDRFLRILEQENPNRVDRAEALMGFIIAFAEAARFYDIENTIFTNYQQQGVHIPSGMGAMLNRWGDASDWLRRELAGGTGGGGNRFPWLGTLIYNAAMMTRHLALAARPDERKRPDRGPLDAHATERVGYFGQWSIYGRNFRIKDVETTGQAARLTVLNYAFENIDPINGTCLMATKATGTNQNDPDQGTGAGDQWADYAVAFTADQSVDGVADVPGQKLRGNFNQLKKLKAKHPQLKILVSLGGWTFSKFFSDVAATDASRKKFVHSCIETYIVGDLPQYCTIKGEGCKPEDTVGGRRTVAGIFDGFDIDWEWPGADTGHPGNHYSAADKANYAALLQEFRNELKAVPGSGSYWLTAFLPANPLNVLAGIDVPAVFRAIDFGNVQGYDFHGPWEPTQTNHAAALYDSPDNPAPPKAKFSGDLAIKLYRDSGIETGKLTLGIPLYGYGWTGVAPGPQSKGLFQSAGGVTPGRWQPGTDDAKSLLAKSDGSVGGGSGDTGLMRDYGAIASWRYDDGTFWSVDDAWVIGQKADYIMTEGLRGAMLWSLDGDDGSLVKVLDQVFLGGKVPK